MIVRQDRRTGTRIATPACSVHARGAIIRPSPSPLVASCACMILQNIFALVIIFKYFLPVLPISSVCGGYDNELISETTRRDHRRHEATHAPTHTTCDSVSERRQRRRRRRNLAALLAPAMISTGGSSACCRRTGARPMTRSGRSSASRAARSATASPGCGDAGILRIVAVVDPVAVDYESDAMLGIKAAPGGGANATVAAAPRTPPWRLSTSCGSAGRFDLLVEVVCDEETELAALPSTTTSTARRTSPTSRS